MTLKSRVIFSVDINLIVWYYKSFTDKITDFYVNFYVNRN